MDKGKLFAALDERQTTTLDLGEFNARLDGQAVEVWLNPPRKIVKEIRKWEEAHKDDDTPLFIGVMLGLTNEETQQLFEKDLAFTNWLVEKVLALYMEYAQKKVPASAS